MLPQKLTGTIYVLQRLSDINLVIDAAGLAHARAH
jgi:hypothetical protein